MYAHHDVVDVVLSCVLGDETRWIAYLCVCGYFSIVLRSDFFGLREQVIRRLSFYRVPLPGTSE